MTNGLTDFNTKNRRLNLDLTAYMSMNNSLLVECQLFLLFKQLRKEQS